MSEKENIASKSQSKDYVTFLDSDWSWSDFSSWPLSVKFAPVLVVIIVVVLPIFYPHIFGELPLDSVLVGDPCVANFNYTFQIARSKHYAETLATQDWEIGTAAEALLELINPEKAVFATDPFPKGKIPSSRFRVDEALAYVQKNVRLAAGPTLYHDDFSVSDPASLGVSAVMLGQRWPGWLEKARTQKDYLLNDAPRYSNGAISHRVEVAELWADAIFMFPPFLAYYAVASKDIALMKEAVRQCELYREVLQIREGSGKGQWRHSVGPSDMADGGAWCTSNAWAAYGMARMRATIVGWATSKPAMQGEIAALDDYILEILEGAIRTDLDKSGLLWNYLGDEKWFGETSGTALMTAAAYRTVMFMQPGSKREELKFWADRKRQAVARSVDDDGVAIGAVNPYAHNSQLPLDGPSPEGQSFLLLMGAAWRDCVCANVCSQDH